MNRAFQEFKDTNDRRLAAVESGRAGLESDYQARLEKMNAAIDAFEARATRLMAEANRAERAGVGGEFRAAAADVAAHRDAFHLYLQKGTAGDLRALEVKATGFESSNDPQGGYLLTPDMQGKFVQRFFETSPIRQIATVQPTTKDRVIGNRDTDEMDGGWVGETGSRAATDIAETGEYEIPVHEVYANPRASQRTLDDTGGALEAFIYRKSADKLARLQNTAFVVGNGIARPRGFASYTTAATADSSRTWGQLEHLVTGTNGGFGTDPNGADKLITLVETLGAAYRQGAMWAMPRLTKAKVRQLKDTNGSYIWLPSMDAKAPSSLLGFGIAEMEDMVAYTTTGALGIAFGDFRAGYLIAERQGVRTLRDPYSAKPRVEFYTTARVGGDVIDFNAIKFLKFAA